MSDRPASPETGLFDRPAEDRLKRSGLVCVLLPLALVVTAAAHWPALSSPTILFDDDQYLTGNHLVQHPTWASAGRFLAEVLEPSTVGGYYQPLAMISIMLDYPRAGRPDNLRPFHETSLALHVANTGLVILLLHALFGSPWAAVIAGLIFGLHPMNVESIPWVAERKTLLAAFFALAGLGVWVRYARAGNRAAYAGALLLFALALLSKPTTTPFPVLLLLLDVWPLRRLLPPRGVPAPSAGRVLLEKAPFFALAVVSAVVTVVSQHRTAEVVRPDEYPPYAIPLVLCHNIVFYLYKLVWPAHLSGFYEIPQPFGLSQPPVMIGLVGTILLLAALGASLRRTRAWATGWLFFFAAIFPTMGVIGFTAAIAADRFVYLPMIGLLLPIADLVARWDRAGPRPPARRAALALAVIVPGLLAFRTRAYLGLWQNCEGFYRHMLATTPDSSSVLMGLGHELQKQKRFPEALDAFRQAVLHDPGLPQARVNLGFALEKLGRNAEAMAQYEEAVRLKPGLAEAHNFLANMLFSAGRAEDALRHYEESIRLKPEISPLRHNYATTLAQIGRPQDAIAHFERAIALDPLATRSHFNLGLTLLNLGRADDAARRFQTALELDPGYAKAHYQLGAALIALGRPADGLSRWRRALQIEPDWPAALNALARVLATAPQPELRDGAEAVRLAEKACRLAENRDADLMETLAAAYAESGRQAEAASAAKRAAELHRSAGRPGEAAAAESLARRFEAGRPLREPLPGTTSRPSGG
jgi:tetratricopeptide (TPR) repeat protein